MSDAAAPPFGLSRVQRRWAAVIAAGLLAVVVVIGVRVAHTTGPLNVDRLGSRVVDSSRVAGELARHHLGRFDSRRTFRRLVWLGSPTFVGAAAASMALWRLAKRDVAGAAFAVMAPVLAGVLTDFVAKPLIDRRIHGGLAFPSGHVTGATALAAVALALAVRHWGWRAAWAAPAAALVPLGVSAGVVRSGFHYATDALGGVAMGTAAVLFGVVLISAIEERRLRRGRLLVEAGKP
jgi:undecaprenyl-diphosphatase